MGDNWCKACFFGAKKVQVTEINPTFLAPWKMYVILFLAVMLLSPVIYEVLRRIPFVWWCVLGMKKPS